MLSTSSAHNPFHMSSRVVITGGNLGKSAWVPDMVDAGGHSGFLKTQKEDRQLAAALGFNKSNARPMEHASFIGFITRLRDEKVDKLIQESMKSADPMGEAPVIAPRIKNREKAFQTAAIPEVINVVVGPLVENYH